MVSVNEADVRPCPECGSRMIRTTPGRGRFPVMCVGCRDARAARKGTRRPRTAATPAVPKPPSAIATIASFGLDYLVGSAARFLLDSRDGDELENLTNARTYLELAIEARSR